MEGMKDSQSMGIGKVQVENSFYFKAVGMESKNIGNNTENIYEIMDRMFSENVAEYMENPYNLVVRLKEAYSDQFKNWKSLHAEQIKQDDLVRMRGMILNGNQTEYSLSVAIAEGDDGKTRTVCGIMRSSINYPNIKEVKKLTKINAYTFVPERGATDWYSRTFDGRNSRTTKEVIFKDENSKIYAKFYDEESNNLGPNAVFDLYGIIDLSGETFAKVALNSTAGHASAVSIHVIHYEPVAHYDIVASAHPEVLQYEIVDGVTAVIRAFEHLLGSKVIAELLVCQLISSRHSFPQESMECVLPCTLKNVRDSQPIIEMIKLFVPKVHVIEVVQGTMEKLWASSFNPSVGFIQGLLQVSDNTLIVIDESKLPSSPLAYTKKGQENYRLVADFLATRSIPFIFPYQTVKIDSNVNVLILSGEKCFLGMEELAMVAPKSCKKGVDYVQQYVVEHDRELILGRHALLSCRKNLCNVDISDIVEEMAVKNFVEMQHIRRNVEGNSARLHRRLMISKLLACLKNIQVADKDCWTKATELENELRIATGRPRY